MTDGRLSPELPDETEVMKAFRASLPLRITEHPEEIGALSLAYLGDTVYELYNRILTVSHGDRPVEKLHRESIERAKAVTQSKLVDVLAEEFTDGEQAVYRRGRNANVHTKAKNASVQEYHRATGLEAVIGYLYLKGETGRLEYLLKKGFDALGL